MPRQRTFPQFSELPKRAEVVYALEASNGLVKIGRSQCPAGRLAKLSWELARSGARPQRFAVVQVFSSSYTVEAELLRRISRCSSPRRGCAEWFEHLTWGMAVNLLRQIGLRQFITLS